jgi:hypothetical protein
VAVETNYKPALAKLAATRKTLFQYREDPYGGVPE